MAPSNVFLLPLQTVHILIKCRMIAFHQFTSVKKHDPKKNILQFKCSQICFKIFLDQYAFTGCNLGVGKFDVSVSNMIIFASIFHQAQVNGQWKGIRRSQLMLNHIPDHESWTTVLEKPSNVEKIWSRHGF